MRPTNFELVKTWMMQAGQDCPEVPTTLSRGVLKLREKLIRGEAIEALDVFACIGDATTNWRDPEQYYADLLKELADVLVVVYGAFVALGIDGDQVFEAVMSNNDKKLAFAMKDGDGKVVTPADVKLQLKKEITENSAKVLGETTMGRAVKLKTLRRVAEQLTKGKPYVKYGDVQHEKKVMANKGGQLIPIKVIRIQRVMASGCTRRIYKEMKEDNPIGTSLKGM
jgi:predicted HAD superfamily Cof-like phosphohydrolase